MIDRPTKEQVAQARADLGLTTAELAEALGFSEDGGRTVRAMESGVRHGRLFQISGPATAALNFLLAINTAVSDFESGIALPSEALIKLKQVLPERLKR